MPQTAPSSVGLKLRRARIERSLSIEETAWRTRIRPDLLRALELDQFEEVGHHAFVKSHLASYARFLGIDPLEVVAQFESEHDEMPTPIEGLERQVQASERPPRAKWWIAAGLSAAVLIAAALIGVLGGQDEKPGANVDALPTISVSTPGVAAAAVRVTLGVDVLQATRLSVIADGTSVFDGNVAPGDAKMFRARDTVELLAADGGTIRLTFNGSPLGVAGSHGAVYRVRFGPKGRLAD